MKKCLKRYENLLTTIKTYVILFVSLKTLKGGTLLDKYRLEYEMKRRNVTQEELCKALKISRSAFYRKCNGLSEFTQGEIQGIVDYLQLDSPMGIFFKEKVS